MAEGVTDVLLMIHVIVIGLGFLSLRALSAIEVFERVRCRGWRGRRRSVIHYPMMMMTRISFGSPSAMATAMATVVEFVDDEDDAMVGMGRCG